MTKNIEDLLYRGDSLERMGDISSRLREDSRKYKKAAVRINWELLLKQVGTLPRFWTQMKADHIPVRTHRRSRLVHNHLHMVAVLLSMLDRRSDGIGIKHPMGRESSGRWRSCDRFCDNTRTKQSQWQPCPRSHLFLGASTAPNPRWSSL
jgi:hypothetical protein